MSIISLLSLAAFIVMIFVVEIPENNKELAYVAGGAFMGSIVGQVVQYYFGSSKGSYDKQQELEKLRSNVKDKQ